MINPVVSEKAVEKVQHCFMILKKQKKHRLNMDRNFLDQIKHIYEKPTANN